MTLHEASGVQKRAIGLGESGIWLNNRKAASTTACQDLQTKVFRCMQCMILLIDLRHRQ